MSQRREQEAILLQEQAVEEKQELLAEEQAANPSEPSPVSYFYNADYDNISTPSTTYTIHLTKSATIITKSFKPTRRIYHNQDIFYDGDDDEELFLDEVKRIQQILERTSFDAILPTFHDYGLSNMGDRASSTIPEMESDELIKSSECNVPICDDFTTVSNPLFDADNDFSSSDDKSFSDFKIFSNPLSDEEIISTKIDPHHFNAESDLIESLLNRDTLIISSPKHFTLIFYDVPSSPRPPAKPPDDGIFFDFEPDTGVLTAKVVEDILEHYVLMPKHYPPNPHLVSILYFASFFTENEDKIALDYEASRACGFVLRSLELQSFA
ncbi:hypothetical protein Tco_0086848 [Tanacetum coccineum]